MSQTATLNASANRYRIQPMPRTLNYSAGVDIRVTATKRRPVLQPVQTVASVEEIEAVQPVATIQTYETVEQEVAPQVQPLTLESTMVMPHYSNLSAEQKAELLARALERYGDPEELVERSERSRALQLRNILDNSYRSVVVTVTKTIPVIVDRVKSVRTAKKTQQMPVEQELVSLAQDEIVKTPEAVVEPTDAHELIAALETAAPTPKKSRKLSQIIIPLVSTVAIALVVVVCVDTWITNRNINQSIDERISVSMQNQSQPSQ